ncbi:Translation initiation factor SUI1 [Musa troglodytarum]|uniref:Translation initiation factor SUI1 n=1 Tax=Musa troglodytarum TaxID=320322 RepID=A0A9E7F5Y6_9LILI|nr:Translation initiation factor SUI1 [Musa troglodytarum]URD89549.1 Translation initiation factor SUI1 [Musa troglodytarum]URD89551.1 Translation initiation factor SUI1 [Musa troglodytarum]URD89555.1 Translation initiation factor SUI1 [Musa troglodytarum]URD89558.1 Translation initiation factor SUI1 [Musa troglodytarum]
MFKKPVEAKLLQRLSGADKKKLRRTTKERFPHASDADIDEILPPKVDITVAKYTNRVHVYVIEGGLPMLFDIDGRGTEIYPTVYALWKVPELLPSFLLKGGEVSRYVIGGADLMFPGISIPPEGLPSFLSGQPWAVKVPGNPAPIAVGATTMSSSEALKAGLRGKALRITHYYRDYLWQSAEGHYIPNAGFLEDVVMEDPNLLSVSQPSDEPLDASNDADHVNTSERDCVDISNIHASTDIDAPLNLDVTDQISKEITADISGLKVSDNVTAEEPSDEKEQQTLSSEEIDALLDKCLLQALHTTVKDKDLPMPGSTLWSNHVLPCRPSGITLDIKKSSHKKLSKWLQSKSSAGLISAKEDKYKKEVMLLGINRGHQEFMAFKPEKRVPENAEQRHDNSVSEVAHTKLQLEVVEVYKPSTHVKSIFTAVGADTGSYYSASDATDIAFRYVEKENLVKPTDKAMVVLDAALCDALYKGTIKKGSTYPTEVHKKDLGSTFLSRMQIHHRVSKGNEVAVRKGAVRPIQIMTERRQGNKKVTRVSGLETFLMDADSLASELQKKFACSTSVGEIPGKKGQHEVLVQGGVIDDLAKHLVDHYGIPKRYIEVLDKTKK